MEANQPGRNFRLRYVRLLRRPAALLLWMGQVSSTAGDRLYAMAMLWVALELTGSTTAMAAVSLFESVPLALAGLVAGVLVDRWDRLRTMVAVDVLRALLLLTLPAAYLAGALQPWHLMAVGVGMGLLGALFDPALNAALPSLVEPDEFPGLAGLMDTPSRFARLLGPGMAGILLTVMPAVHFFTLDSLTFVVSALCVAAVMRLTGAPRQQVPAGTASTPAKRRPWLHDVPAGWRLVWQDRCLPAIIGADAAGNLAWAAFSLGGLILCKERLGSGPGGYGLLIGAYGLGSLAGNVLAGNGELGFKRSTLAVSGWLLIGLCFAGLGAAPNMAWAMACTALAGVGGSVAHVSRAAYLGRAVPGAHLGKVYSVQRLATTLAGAAGTLLVGRLLEKVTATAVLALGGGFMVVAGIAALVSLLRRERSIKLIGRTARSET